MEVDFGRPRAYFLRPDGSVISRPITYVVPPGVAQRVINEDNALRAYLKLGHTDGKPPPEVALLTQSAQQRTIDRAELLLHLDSGVKKPGIFDKIRHALNL